MTPLLSTRPSVERPKAVTEELPLEIARDAVRFPDGLPGFEACRSFVLMQNEVLGPLQLPEGDRRARGVVPGHRSAAGAAGVPLRAERGRPASARRRPTPDTLLWLVLVTIELDGTITANLRAPVVINPERMIGQQVVPYHCVYPIRHVIAEGE